MKAEPDFRLGPLTVRPLSHEIVAQQVALVLEPRVMQVLVELARRRGDVVARDALVETCWSGRAVSEDAIQRCIARLRRVSDMHGGFSIDTIRSVGYRLIEIEETGVKQPSLAVLAFDNLSGDPALQYFSDGISDEILHAVSRAAPLRVIGRASSFRFRGLEKTIANVASALDVSHILDGSVRRSGNRLRISVRLIETATEQAVWSDRFDRELTDSFAVQDEIAQAVTAALGVTFLARTPLRGVDPFAYDLYQRGRELGALFGIPGATRRAIALIEEAVTRAPTLAPAWALLAQLQVQYRAREAPEHDIEPLRLGIIEAVNHALVLDPEDGGALACLAFVEPPVGAFEKQEEILLRAMATRNASGVVAPFSTFCASVGRNREALSLVETAWQGDPLHPGIANWRAILLWQNGLSGESNAVLDSVIGADGIAGTLLGHAAVLAAFDNDWVRADDLLSRSTLRSREARDVQGMQLTLSTVATLRDPSEQNRSRLLQQADADLTTTGSIPLGTLCLLAHLGLTDEAFDLAGRASFDGLSAAGSRLQIADIGLHFLFSPPARPLRCDPRFVDLCAKLGLAAFWTSTGHWPDCADDIASHYDFISQCSGVAAERRETS